MKKIISLFCVALLVLSFSACAGKSSQKYENTPEGTAEKLFDSLKNYDEASLISCFANDGSEKSSFFPDSESSKNYIGAYKALLSKLTYTVINTEYNTDNSKAGVKVKVNYCDATDATVAALVEASLSQNKKKNTAEMLGELLPEKIKESDSILEAEMVIPLSVDENGCWLVSGLSHDNAELFVRFFTCGIAEGVDKFREMSELG